MSSSVHFRFKSAREFETLSFEGDFLKVADLKIAIVERKKLNFGEGFDLEISDASTGDVFNNEDALVQKNTSVIVRRIPGLKQGGILSHQEMAGKNERYSEKQNTKPLHSTAAIGDQNSVLPKTIEGSDEAERMASLVMQSNVQFDQFPRPIKGRYSNRSSSRGRPGNSNASRNTQSQAFSANAGNSSSSYPDRAPRPSSNYVCHRCNRPGHWIDQCPTNGDPTYDRIKVRAPTGIPRSMLRQVDAPESGTGLQDSSGHFVTLQPNEEEFARQTVGLRLSQAAKSGMDKEPTSTIGSKDRESTIKPGENGALSSGPQSPPDDENNPPVKVFPPLGKKDAIKESAQDIRKQAAGEAIQTAKTAAPRSSPDLDSSRERDNENSSTGSKENLNGKVSLPRHSEKSFASSKIQQSQPAMRGGAPHMPVLVVPPGFPPLGMAPIPPGMPPIPPHILMAMAMGNGQSGPCPPLPPGMHGNISMPFSGSTPSYGDQTKHSKVNHTEKRSPQEQQLASAASKHENARVEKTNMGGKSASKSQSPSPTRDGSENPTQGDDVTGRHGVDRQSSEVIESAFKPKHHLHGVRNPDLIREENRIRHQSFLGENEAVVEGERHGFREPESVTNQHDRTDGKRRKRSPSSSRLHSPLDEDRKRRRARSEKREGFSKSLSHERGESDDTRKDRYRHSGGREERRSRYPSPGYREGSRHGSISGDARRGFYSRRSRSPVARGRHSTFRSRHSDSPIRESQSSALGSRYGSPSHRSRGGNSRDWAANVSPNGAFQRKRFADRRYRSVTPPKKALKYNLASEEDFQLRPPLPHSQRSLPPERYRNPPFGESHDDDRQRLEAAGRTTSKISELPEQESDKNLAVADLEKYPKETGGRVREASETPTQSTAGDMRTQREKPGRSRLKREYESHLRSGEGDYKRSRRDRIEGRRYRYSPESRDRPSVHDRLGGPLESRRRKGQRRSVHDRLG